MTNKQHRIKCKYCGRFCGTGARQERSYDWQGIPVEDFMVCTKCDVPAIRKDSTA